MGVFGSLYGVWLLYSAGLAYLLYTAIFYLLGVPFFVWTRREQKANLHHCRVGTPRTVHRRGRLRRLQPGLRHLVSLISQ